MDYVIHEFSITLLYKKITQFGPKECDFNKKHMQIGRSVAQKWAWEC